MRCNAKQRHLKISDKENGIYRSSNACICSLLQITEIFNRWPQWLRSGL